MAQLWTGPFNTVDYKAVSSYIMSFERIGSGVYLLFARLLDFLELDMPDLNRSPLTTLPVVGQSNLLALRNKPVDIKASITLFCACFVSWLRANSRSQ